MTSNIEKIKKYLNDLDISRRDSEIRVKISVMHFDDHRCREKVRVELSDVISILSEKKIRVGRCLRSGSIQNKRCSTSEWIFENPQRKRNTKKTKKVLDNLSKSVIIE
jgi:hypothetical protein